MNKILDIAIVGAGLAGITIARQLHPHYRGTWLLIDKGRSVGGRLATRRIEQWKFDHGAQFFTVRTLAFREVITPLIEKQIVQEWCRGFNGREDGYPRYAVTGGMNQLPKYLATALPPEQIVRQERVTRLDWESDRWVLHSDSGKQWSARKLVLTMPLPQTLTLLDPLESTCDFNPLLNQLRAVDYDPCVAVLAKFDLASSDVFKTPLRFQSGAIAFIADNATKLVSSSGGCLTIHLEAKISSDVYQWTDDDTLNFTLEQLRQTFPQINWERPAIWQVHRWRYAKPKSSIQPEFLHWTPPDRKEASLFIAGEVFGASRVEAAFLSGLAAGNALLLKP